MRLTTNGSLSAFLRAERFVVPQLIATGHEFFHRQPARVQFTIALLDQRWLDVRCVSGTRIIRRFRFATARYKRGYCDDGKPAGYTDRHAQVLVPSLALALAFAFALTLTRVTRIAGVFGARVARIGCRIGWGFSCRRTRVTRIVGGLFLGTGARGECECNGDGEER